MTMRDYSRRHRALLETARIHGLAPADVQFVVALWQRGGESTTDVLQGDLALPEGAALRRSMLRLRPFYMHGGDRRGTRKPVVLTPEGMRLARHYEERLMRLTQVQPLQEAA